jgi:hypothetical protein
LFLLLECFLFFDEGFDPLIFSQKEGFYLYSRSFNLSFGPVDVWFECSPPWEAENESVFSQISDIEPLSFLLVSKSDH